MHDHQQVTRRSAVSGDTEWARSTHHAAVRDVVERQFGVWDEAQQNEFFDKEWMNGPYQVLECNGVPCGYVCIEHRADELHLRELVIAPDFQGRGIGTAIVADAVERARQRRAPVTLETLHENRAASLYRRLGFVEVGRTETHTLFRLDP